MKVHLPNLNSQTFLPNGVTILLPKGGYQPFRLGEVLGKLHIYSRSSAKSLSASLSMVAPWWLPSFLSLESPKREAAMWRFPKATLLTEVITVSPGVTLMASKFNLPMEVVIVSMHYFFPSYLVRRCGRAGQFFPQSSSGNNPVLCHGRASSPKRASDLLGHQCQFWQLALLCHPWGVSTDTGRLVSAGKVLGSAGGASSLGVHLSDARMVLSVPWVIAGLGFKPPILAVVVGAMAPSGGASVSWLPPSGSASPRPWKTSCLLKVTCPSIHHFNSTTLIAKGQ